VAKMNETRLVVLYGGARVGEIVQGQGGRLTFFYDARWRTLPQATPLSLSMPLAAPVPHSSLSPTGWSLCSRVRAESGGSTRPK